MDKTRKSSLMRVFGLALLALGLSAGTASARSLEGKFTLPFEARWGQATLPAGDYSFHLEATVSPYLIQVLRGRQSVALIFCGAVSESRSSGHSRLIVLLHGRTGTICALELTEAKRVFFYNAPKAERQFLAQAPQLIQSLPITVNGK